MYTFTLPYRDISLFGALVYISAFTGTYFAQPQMDGQAELAWMGHPSQYTPGMI